MLCGYGLSHASPTKLGPELQTGRALPEPHGLGGSRDTPRLGDTVLRQHPSLYARSAPGLWDAGINQPTHCASVIKCNQPDMNVTQPL